MKNLNPTAGLRQIVSGYFCLPRKIILELIKSKQIKPVELGMFIIFLCSADWDNDKHRNSYVRHEFLRLSNIWNLPKSTLYDYAKTLHNKRLLGKDGNTYKVNNFMQFTPKGALEVAREKTTNDYLETIFPSINNNSVISDNNEIKQILPFNVSSKVEFNVYPKRVYIKQSIRTVEEYKQFYIDGGFQYLTPEDMQWIDENVNEIIEVNDEQMEREIVEIYFYGDWNKYKSYLI